MRNVNLSRPFPCAAHNCTLDIYPPANEKPEAPIHLRCPLARLIQNGFTGEARKTGFFRLLIYFNPGLQNGFTLQCLDLRKIDEAEVA